MPMTNTQKKNVTKELVRRIYVQTGTTANFDSDELAISISNIFDYFEANAAAINNLFDTNVKNNATVLQKSQIVAIAAMKYGGFI